MCKLQRATLQALQPTAFRLRAPASAEALCFHYSDSVQCALTAEFDSFTSPHRAQSSFLPFSVTVESSFTALFTLPTGSLDPKFFDQSPDTSSSSSSLDGRRSSQLRCPERGRENSNQTQCTLRACRVDCRSHFHSSHRHETHIEIPSRPSISVCNGHVCMC